MENRSRYGIVYGRILLAGVVMCLLMGCGASRSPYPEAKVKTALGIASTCAFCRQEIPHVEPSNMHTVKGVAYTVCDAKCAAKLDAWAKDQ